MNNKIRNVCKESKGSFTVKEIKWQTGQIDDVTRDRYIDILKLLFVCDLCARVCVREKEKDVH